jgi:hypothetical protein
MIETIEYRVIHKISAVSKRCNEVVEFKKILKNINRKNKNNKFKLSTIIKKN